MGRTRTILIKESGKRKIELTVNPEEITLSESLNNQTFTLNQVGTMILPGSRGLIAVQVNTFLPASHSPFYDGDSPRSILKLIGRWKENKTKLRIIISGTGINMRAILSQTSESYREGDKDVYIDWSFIEYKEVTVPTVESIAGTINVTDPVLQPREGEAPGGGGTSEKVNSNTTLWALAVKYYGDGTQWKKISAANGNIDPTKLREGMELVIP